MKFMVLIYAILKMKVILKSSRKMITNLDWLNPKVKPYFRQTKLSSAHVSPDCIKKLVDDIEQFNKGQI